MTQNQKKRFLFFEKIKVLTINIFNISSSVNIFLINPLMIQLEKKRRNRSEKSN